MNTLIEIIGWLGSVCIFAGLYGVAHKRRNAFFFSIVGELAWVVKSVYLHAWDLLSMTLAFAALAAYGYWAWGEEARKAKRAESDEQRQRLQRLQQAEAANDARIEAARIREQQTVWEVMEAEKRLSMAQIAAARKDATY